mmetsp:Transcript_71851/g.166245  ORF Transcript_71851/g.166245 Transcript_71851/m.166245 type:complete len:541 (-) Transcript_71851:76-1698(-)
MQSNLVQGFPVRVDPASAQAQDVPVLQGLPVEKQNQKIEAVRLGASLLEENPPLPGHRPWQDTLWLTLFLATIAVTALLAYVGFSTVGELGAGQSPRGVGQASVESSTSKPLLLEGHQEHVHLLFSALGGAGAAIIAAFGFVMLAHAMPACVVSTSLIVGPVITILMGPALFTLMMLQPAPMNPLFVGLGLFVPVIVGVCSLCWICCRWNDYVPFMIKMTEVVTNIVEHQPCLLVVPFIGVALGSLWAMVGVLAALGLAYYCEDEIAANEDDSEGFSSLAYLPVLLVYFWGAGVAFNVCHVTTAGVFGRWYHGGDASSSDSDSNSEFGPAPATLVPSLKVATTTSLGSVCFGSLVVASIRLLVVLARIAENRAREDGNAALCILACCVKCLLQCIEDVIEYFNEWAYIQCALRGTDFCTSAKITYTMLTCANVQYIIQDLLFNSLLVLGSLLCGLAGAACGALVGFALDGFFTLSCGLGALSGFLVGNIAGSVALSTLSSGTKTILACWANDPAPLALSQPEVCKEFEARVKRKLRAIGR